MSKEVDENEKNLVQDTFLISSTALRGGDKPNIDTIYNKFYSLVDEILNSFEYPERLDRLKEDISSFIQESQKKMKELVLKKNNGADFSYQALTPTLQNLVMAATQINVKLAESESLLTNYLSDLYSNAAENVYELLKKERDFFVNLKEENIQKMRIAHKKAVESIMGAEIADFSLKAFQTLNNDLLQNSTDSNPTTLEELSLSLQSAKHSLRCKLNEIKTPEFIPVLNNVDKNYELRMKLHTINSEIEDIINSKLNPEEIAKKLRILRAAEEESKAQLDSNSDKIDTISNENPREINKDEIESLIVIIDSMIDRARILKVQSSLIQKEIENEIKTETQKEIKDRQNNNRNIIHGLRKKIEDTRTEILKQHEIQSKGARDAEKTLLSEMNKYGKNYGSNLQICTKAISEVARYQKTNLDISAINYNKRKLESIVKKIQSLIF